MLDEPWINMPAIYWYRWPLLCFYFSYRFSGARYVRPPDGRCTV